MNSKNKKSGREEEHYQVSCKQTKKKQESVIKGRTLDNGKNERIIKY